MKKIILLSSSMLTNRIFSKTFFEKISENNKIIVWAKTPPPFANKNIQIESFPKVKANPFIFDFIRKINTLAWANKLKINALLSQNKFNKIIYENLLKQHIINFLAKLVALLNLHFFTEIIVQKASFCIKRSSEAYKRLKNKNIDYIVITNPFWSLETAVISEAKRFKIKIILLVPSWDNLTTKSRITFCADAYLVWNNIMKKELLKIYPKTKSKPIFLYSTPQYEVFFDDEFYMSKEDFFNEFKLKTEKKIVLYIIGSPNMIKTELEGAKKFAILFKKDSNFKNCQLLIRPHPNKDNNELEKLHNPNERIFVQKTRNAGAITTKRNLNKKDIKIWVNTFKYSDVVINLSSSSIFDAIICNKPIININFDPCKKGLYNTYIKEINSQWEHLKPVYKSKYIYFVSSFEELKEKTFFLINNYKTKKYSNNILLQNICGIPNKETGKKLANNIISIIKN